MSDEMDSIYHNKLKDFSISEIESVIAKAISDLTGVKYNCDINTSEYTHTIGMVHGMDIRLSLQEHKRFDLAFSAGERPQSPPDTF